MNDLTQLDRSKLAWRRDPASKDGSSVHRRLLGPTEHGFYWDVLFNGVAIAINSAEVEVAGGREEDMFAKENFEAAWVRLKQQHLLLAASMDDSRGKDLVEFVLDERALYTLRPGEVAFLDCRTDEEADKLTDELQNGIHKPDPDILAKVWVVAIANKPRTRRIYIAIQHHITDGVGNASIMRGYCQELSTSSKKLVVDGLGPLAERLHRTQPLELFTPGSRLNLPRRRWRLAIAKVISELLRNKPQGGHTLPKLPTSGDDAIVPALSRTVYAPALPVSVSSQILKSCRELGITFGNALPVLSQLGHARVLHRLYHEGKISEQEWQQRRIEPMIFTGPINIRPYLDRDWFQNGGEHEVLMAISFWNTVLPFMPTSSVVAEGGVPPFDTLLSHKRFLHRALLARKQQTKRLKYPLLLDFHELRMPGRIRATRVLTQRWEAQQEGREYTGNEAQYGGSFKTMGSCVFANGGSSLGNRDKVIPLEYPLPMQDSPPPTPRLRIVHYRSALRCRPTELYLGAVTSHEQLRFYAHVDANTFDESLVREWVEEVGKAAVHYLGTE